MLIWLYDFVARKKQRELSDADFVSRKCKVGTKVRFIFLLSLKIRTFVSQKSHN